MRLPRTVFGKVFLGTAVLVVLSLSICSAIILRQVGQLHTPEVKQRARVQAELLAAALAEVPEAQWQAVFKRMHKRNDGQGDWLVAVVSPDGQPLFSTAGPWGDRESLADWPEVRDALAERYAEQVRYSSILHKYIYSVAVRLGGVDRPRAVLMVGVPIYDASREALALYHSVWTVTLTSLATAIVFALILARIWSRPIRRMSRLAQRLSRGDLNVRIRGRGRDEVAALADALEQVRLRLVTQVASASDQTTVLQMLFRQTEEGVILADSAGRIVLINPQAAQFMGEAGHRPGALEALIGASVEQAVPHHRLQLLLLGQRGMQAGESVGEGHEAQAGVEKITVPGGDEPGERTLLAKVVEVVLSGQGGPYWYHDVAEGTGRLLLLTDRTAKEQAARAKADFVTNASYYLRAPLTAVRSAVEGLIEMSGGKESAETQAYLDSIRRQSEQMELMISDLFDLAQVETGGARYRPENVDIHNFMYELESRFGGRFEHRRLRWSVQVDEGLETVSVNEYLLRLVVYNLVDNAIKYTEPGGQLHLSVEVYGGTEGPGRTVSLSVVDTGLGIPDNEQARVFERFYQVDRGGEDDGGTGLGLSIVRHAVAAMGGRIDLDSKLGRGTRITVTWDG